MGKERRERTIQMTGPSVLSQETQRKLRKKQTKRGHKSSEIRALKQRGRNKAADLAHTKKRKNRKEQAIRRSTRHN